MHQLMPTSRSGFAQRLTRQRMDRRANPSRTVGAATVTAERIRLLARAWGFATVPRLAIPQRSKAWRDWARRASMALRTGRCRGNSLPWRAAQVGRGDRDTHRRQRPAGRWRGNQGCSPAVRAGALGDEATYADTGP